MTELKKIENKPLFIGLAPKSEAGKICFDEEWRKIEEFIWSEIDGDDFPDELPYDDECAKRLAERIQSLLDWGVAHAYFLLKKRKFILELARKRTKSCGWYEKFLNYSLNNDASTKEVDDKVRVLNGYVVFFRECGGFDLVG